MTIVMVCAGSVAWRNVNDVGDVVMNPVFEDPCGCAAAGAAAGGPGTAGAGATEPGAPEHEVAAHAAAARTDITKSLTAVEEFLIAILL
jgi:hypothetical protein